MLSKFCFLFAHLAGEILMPTTFSSDLQTSSTTILEKLNYSINIFILLYVQTIQNISPVPERGENMIDWPCIIVLAVVIWQPA
jgi:hypothetical protein